MALWGRAGSGGRRCGRPCRALRSTLPNWSISSSPGRRRCRLPRYQQAGTISWGDFGAPLVHLGLLGMHHHPDPVLMGTRSPEAQRGGWGRADGWCMGLLASGSCPWCSREGEPSAWLPASALSSLQKATDGKKVVVVLDPKRSNAINIGLTVLPPVHIIKTAVLNFDEFAVNKEGIEVSSWAPQGLFPPRAGLFPQPGGLRAHTASVAQCRWRWGNTSHLPPAWGAVTWLGS